MWNKSVIVFRLTNNTLEEIATLRETDRLESPVFLACH